MRKQVTITLTKEQAKALATTLNRRAAILQWLAIKTTNEAKQHKAEQFWKKTHALAQAVNEGLGCTYMVGNYDFLECQLDKLT